MAVAALKALADENKVPSTKVAEAISEIRHRPGAAEPRHELTQSRISTPGVSRREMSVIDVKVPDIGDFKDVPIIEVHVKPGDTVKRDDPLITLESDKATMEVPAPEAGKVAEILVKVGDKVSEGSAIVSCRPAQAQPPAPRSCSRSTSPSAPPAAARPHRPPPRPQPPPEQAADRRRASRSRPGSDFGGVHASPSVRRLARELDIDLTQAQGHRREGPHHQGRRQARARRGAARRSGGAGIPEIPAQDFSKFGPIETKPLSRLKTPRRARTCTAPGSTSRTSPTPTRPTSPTSRPTARRSTRRPRRRAIASRCWPS